VRICNSYPDYPVRLPANKLRGAVHLGGTVARDCDEFANDVDKPGERYESHLWLRG